MKTTSKTECLFKFKQIGNDYIQEVVEFNYSNSIITKELDEVKTISRGDWT